MIVIYTSWLYVLKMPREKTLYQFRCKELFCGNYVRSDKWAEHYRLPKETCFQSSAVGQLLLLVSS